MRKFRMKCATGVLAAMMAISMTPGSSLPFIGNTVSVSAAQMVKEGNSFSFGAGNYQNTLKEGTYQVPVKLQDKDKTNLDAADIFSDSYKSQAGDCINGPAEVKVSSDGEAIVTVAVRPITVYGTTLWGKNWKIVQPGTNQKVDATVVEGTADKPTKIQFTWPKEAKNGVYVQSTANIIDKSAQAIFAFNWKEAKLDGADQPSTPDTPDQPSTPDQPNTPDTPDQPNTPDTPATVKVPASFKVSAIDYQKAKVSWAKVDGAAGYEVYQNGKKVKDTTATSYTQSGLKTGSTYKYKVRAYQVTKNKKIYSNYTVEKSVKTVLGKVSNIKVNNSKKMTATVTWKKVSGANGYYVYRATSAKGKYKQLKIVKGNAAVTYADKKVKKNKKYYYKVRAYRSVSGKNVYGTYSSAVNVTIKK